MCVHDTPSEEAKAFSVPGPDRSGGPETRRFGRQLSASFRRSMQGEERMAQSGGQLAHAKALPTILKRGVRTFYSQNLSVDNLTRGGG